jgi:muramoyltetrapeptide carboxypeptidase
MPYLHERYRYTAGTREQRTRDLLSALSDPSIRAVWYARGGSGSVHHLSAIETDSLDQRPVIGFSDATSLLSHLWNHRAAQPVHGPVLHTLATSNDAATVEATRALLFGERNTQSWSCEVLSHADEVRGPLVGGNLCVLASVCGTPFQLNARGCILLLEEVGEAPYKVDRLLTQLRLAGGLDGVQAVILGDFTGGDPPLYAKWTIPDVVAECLEGLHIPILTGAPVGHGSANHPFVVGSWCEVDRRGQVQIGPPREA